ncbi:MATE family efflux transporter, partial [Anaerotruncus massiliensis (ex Togo et al. 2019)]
MERDLTVGSVPKQLLSFAAPLFLANLLQSLYSIVDMAVVGRFVGSAGLAAVSSAAMLSFIIQSVCTGVTTGGAVLIAQYKGARDTRGQRETTGALFSVSALAALLVTAAGLLAYRPVFSLMNLPAEALPHALRYMRVICLGTVFVFGYNAVCSVLRGLGDSKSPLFFVAVATAVNILLDLLLVGPLGLGTEGAAIATAASQGVSFLTAVFVLRRRGLPLDFSPSYFRTAPKTCRAILRIGFPTAVQMTVLNLSYLLVTGMLNGYG